MRRFAVGDPRSTGHGGISGGTCACRRVEDAQGVPGHRGSQLLPLPRILVSVRVFCLRASVTLEQQRDRARRPSDAQPDPPATGRSPPLRTEASCSWRSIPRTPRGGVPSTGSRGDMPAASAGPRNLWTASTRGCSDRRSPGPGSPGAPRRLQRPETVHKLMPARLPPAEPRLTASRRCAEAEASPTDSRRSHPHHRSCRRLGHSGRSVRSSSRPGNHRPEHPPTSWSLCPSRPPSRERS